jgi:hypothetical protein
VPGHVERSPLVGWHDAGEHRRAHAARVPAQIDQRRPAAPGAAEDVELFVAESGPDLFDVVDAAVVVVLAEIGRVLEPFVAGLHLVGRQILLQGGLEPGASLKLGAEEAAGATGAAEIDQQDVPPFVEDAEERGSFGSERHGGFARAAAEDREGIGQPVRTRGRKDQHPQRDLAARLRRPVLPDLIGATPGPRRHSRDGGSPVKVEQGRQARAAKSEAYRMIRIHRIKDPS